MLNVGYVPEHFSSPILQLEASEAANVTSTGEKLFKTESCPSGTGQMITKLGDGSIDVSIALTESLIAGIAKGNTTYKLIGSYVKTPLNWAVITGKDTKFNSINDLRGETVGISRIGSGSQVMASVMAHQQGWANEKGETEEVKYKINDSFINLRNSVNDGTTAYFMWEHFTTKPYMLSGEVRFIGNQLTPWPSWVIAARTEVLEDPTKREELSAFLSALGVSVRKFDSKESREKDNIEYLKEHFSYPENDIKAWLDTVGYFSELAEVDGKMVLDTLAELELAGVVKKPEAGWSPDTFVDSKVAKIL